MIPTTTRTPKRQKGKSHS